MLFLKTCTDPAVEQPGSCWTQLFILRNLDDISRHNKTSMFSTHAHEQYNMEVSDKRSYISTSLTRLKCSFQQQGESNPKSEKKSAASAACQAFLHSKNLDAGRIYSARADKTNKGGAAKGGGTKKDRKDKIFPVLLFWWRRGSRTPVRKRFNGNFSGRRRLFTFPYPGVSRHTQGLGSFIVHGALKALRHTCTTKRRPIPARGPSGLDGCS